MSERVTEEELKQLQSDLADLKKRLEAAERVIATVRDKPRAYEAIRQAVQYFEEATKAQEVEGE